jgi:asparagine synthase (glutamine-hydrolysing)
MCGILGLVGTRWLASAEMALQSLNSRGPDAQTIYRDNELALGHARLSVIDIVGGSQPMHTHDGQYTIVFNGEIYNAGLLRQELESVGVRFFSDHSDTEVLLNGYRHWGKDLLLKLDGMFAFAVWDRRSRKLFAARDKFGIKPFVYANLDQGFIFASTLSPFFRLPGFPRKLNPTALRDYLSFQTPLSPDTFLKDVIQLPPAHCLEFDFANNHLTTSKWWSIPEKNPLRMDLEELTAIVDESLKESVKRQIVADVPLGAFLSGGIDSSLMIHYMAQLSSRPIDTFTLQFDDDGFDESSHALAVAQHFGCNHHLVEAPSIDANYLVRAIQDLDQPLADPAYVMTYALSERTRKNVTVAISGDGGDELFAGYNRYRVTQDHYPSKPWQAPLKKLIDQGLLPGALTRRALSGQDMLLYSKIEAGPWKGRKNLAPFVSPDLFTAMQINDTLLLWRSLVNEFGGNMDSDTLMRADLWTYLSENCLVKTDRASMAHGLEIRVPMLGEPVLNAVLQVPASVHLKQGTKTLLTLLAKKHLPRTVWDRPKHGFSVPLKNLFNGAWEDIANDYISKTSHIAPFLNQSCLKDRWDRINQSGQSKRLMYAFLVLLIWMEKNQVEFDS